MGYYFLNFNIFLIIFRYLTTAPGQPATEEDLGQWKNNKLGPEYKYLASRCGSLLKTYSGFPDQGAGGSSFIHFSRTSRGGYPDMKTKKEKKSQLVTVPQRRRRRAHAKRSDCQLRSPSGSSRLMRGTIYRSLLANERPEWRHARHPTASSVKSTVRGNFISCFGLIDVGPHERFRHVRSGRLRE